MRVTEKTLYQQSVAGLGDNLERLQQLQLTIATGKRINTPSDDPSGSAAIIRFDTFQEQVSQYVRNTEAADTPLKVTDTTLTAVVNLLLRVKSVALSQASGGSTANERATLALEVGGAFQQLVQLANTNFNGQYLFAGFQTQAPAFDNAGVYQGDDGTAEIEIGPGATVARNLPGDAVFGAAAGGVDIFAQLSSLQTAITAGDSVAIQALLAPLEVAVQQVAQSQAEVGVRLQELDTARQSARSLSRTVTDARAGREQADVAQAITEFQIQSSVLKAVQESTARILQTSLLDFLR
jgi:flagellar hook-associated protein 3 FlgL